MISLKDKQDCAELLARILDRTSNWRRKTAEKYSTDPRNARAAEMLDRLVADSVALSDDEWEALRPHCCGWDSQSFHQAVSQAAKLVGFAHRNVGLDSFV